MLFRYLYFHSQLLNWIKHVIKTLPHEHSVQLLPRWNSAFCESSALIIQLHFWVKSSVCVIQQLMDAEAVRLQSSSVNVMLGKWKQYSYSKCVPRASPLRCYLPWDCFEKWLYVCSSGTISVDSFLLFHLVIASHVFLLHTVSLSLGTYFYIFIFQMPLHQQHHTQSCWKKLISGMK